MLAEHDCRLGVCTCVGVCAVTSPSREFRAKQHQRLCSVTELEQEIKNTLAPTPGKHQTPPFDSVEGNGVEVDQEGRRLVLYIEPKSGAGLRSCAEAHTDI